MISFIHKRERSARRLKCLEWASRKICAAAATLRRSVQTSVRPSVRSPLPDARGDQASDPADAAPRLGHHFGGKCHLEMRLHSLVAAVGRSVGRSSLPSFRVAPPASLACPPFDPSFPLATRPSVPPTKVRLDCSCELFSFSNFQ